MGTKITDLFEKEIIKTEELKGKVLAVDTYNQLYMFLTTIRQRDGSALTDSNGRVTSHLVGLFNRFVNLIAKGIRFVFVFDGEPPELKREERKRRREVKEEAMKKYEEAEREGDIEEMGKYAGRTAVLTKEMAEEAKELIRALGMPIVQAKSEGEAQAAYLVEKGDAYACLSQDADSFLFKAERVVRNLTISGKRKKTGTSYYGKVEPEMMSLSKNLNKLGVSLNQLIVIAILVGTDYDPGGIKGIGPKKALKLVKEKGENFEEVFKEVEWEKHWGIDWKDIFELFKKMPVEKNYKLEWKPVDEDKVIEVLVEKHDFSRERVENSLKKIKESKDRKQKGLGEFF